MDLASESISKILGRLDSRDFLRFYPHASAPCCNLNKSGFENNIEFNDLIYKVSKGLSYNFTYPLPEYAPNFINRQLVNGIDPALTLVKEKGVWEKYKNQLLKYCSLKQAGDVESYLDSSNSHQASWNIVLLANHMGKDPDQHLTVDYNIYYSGGNLSHFNRHSNKYLIRPKSDENGIIFVDHLSQNKDISISDHETRLEVDTQTNGKVYQIETSCDFMVTRHKEKVSLFSIQEGESFLKFVKNYEVESNTPFFSVALNAFAFCTVSADRKLEVFDVNRDTPVVTTHLDSDEEIHMSDKWCSAHYVDNNILCITDRKSASFLDLRARNKLVCCWPISDVTEHCEEIFCATSGFGSIEYIVSSHQLLCLDYRAGFSQRWTHGITHSPAYISVLHEESLDNIFIGSQRKDSVVFIENNHQKDTNVSFVQPYLVPSLVETLHQARYNGYCLGNTVSSRFNMNTTGLCCLDDENGLKLLRITSIGDVFGQYLLKYGRGSDIPFNSDDLQILDKWEQYCEVDFHKKDKTCSVGNILKDKHLLESLCNKGDIFSEAVQKADISTAPWRIPKKELKSFCDYLAPKLLQVWNIEDEEEWAEETLAVDGSTEESSTDDEEDMAERVSKWIETYADDWNEVDYAFEDVPSLPLNPSISGNMNTTTSDEETCENDKVSSVTPHSIMKNSQPKSTRKKHVAGF